MSKNTTFFGQPIFSQLINFIDPKIVSQSVAIHKSDSYCKRFTTFQHLITILYGVVSNYNSLRELTVGIPEEIAKQLALELT